MHERPEVVARYRAVWRFRDAEPESVVGTDAKEKTGAEPIGRRDELVDQDDDVTVGAHDECVSGLQAAARR